MARIPSAHGLLARIGFAEPSRAAQSLAQPEFTATLQAAFGEDFVAHLGELFANAADPDQGLIYLHRLSQRCQSEHWDALIEALRSHGTELLALLGGSRMLGDWLINNPGALVRWPMPTLIMDEASIRGMLLTSVGAQKEAGHFRASILPHDGGLDALRAAYWELMAGLATTDLSHPNPQSLQPSVSTTLSYLAYGYLEAALALAYAAVSPEDQATRLAIIAMGKAGSQELNYISDVDVLYVVAPGPGQDEAAAISGGIHLATFAAKLCTTVSAQPPVWNLDANLRPEGKDGLLVRTVASYDTYYQRWAQSWEFQALLKASAVAGDRQLGSEFVGMAAPHVWNASARADFVPAAQEMRRRVEAHIKPSERPWQIKLGEGGLRDVEFTVQLLQLVHGRVDESLRLRSTEEALSALSAGGYVSRDHGQELMEHYRFLRVIEHRCQVKRMIRTHLFPAHADQQQVLARSLGLPLEKLLERWQHVRRRVRILHELIFYRPLLPATAQLSAEDVSLSPDRAEQRLAALGYTYTRGALDHIAALTTGLSRRAAIQRQLLPVMLNWFASGPDPDAALLGFRNVSDVLGSTHWYLKLLRDSPLAAERLAKVLSHSKYATQLLLASPEAISWLDEDAELRPLSAEQLTKQAAAIGERHLDAQEAATALRGLRRREMTRCALADVIHGIDAQRTGAAITACTDAVLDALAGVAIRHACQELVLKAPPGEFSIIAMGRLGGGEVGYASDADVMYVYRSYEGGQQAEDVTERWALAVAVTVGRLASESGVEPALEVDATLRPEGKNGPLVRSLAAYTHYYQRWAMGWERQALLRARPISGPLALRTDFENLINPLRYAAEGISEAEVTEIRRLKARMEAERLPRGASRARHVKLGDGGLVDVEWAIQVLQLRWAGEYPQLQTTQTLAALEHAHSHGFLTQSQADALRSSWVYATKLRQAMVLWTGSVRANKVDTLPTTAIDGRGVAALLNIDSATAAQEVEQQWLRLSRLSRHVSQEVLY